MPRKIKHSEYYKEDDFYGVHIPYVLIERLGLILSFNLASYYYGVGDLTNSECISLIENEIGEYKFFSPEEIKEILSKKTPQINFSLNWYPTKKCSWCMCETLILHEHHYPIPKKNFGKEIEKICPNCHAEYHRLSDYPIFKIFDDINILFISCEKERLNA